MSDSVAADVKTIGAYLKTREGKRWRDKDTETVLAKAAEIDRLLERLLRSAGYVTEAGPKALDSNQFGIPTTAHFS